MDFVLSGGCVIFLWTRPRRIDIIATFIVAALVRQGLLAITGGFQPYFGSALIRWGAFFGLGSLFVSAARALAGDRKALKTLGAIAVFPYLMIVLTFMIPVGEHLDPKTFDRFLYISIYSMERSDSKVLFSLAAFYLFIL